MDAITYTEARNHLAETMDRVSEDHEPIIITRRNGRNVVLMSLEDFNAWQETEYLLRSPANAADLLRAAEEIRERRNLVRRDLAEE
jgi:antitoxin YefM